MHATLSCRRRQYPHPACAFIQYTSSISISQLNEYRNEEKLTHISFSRFLIIHQRFRSNSIVSRIKHEDTFDLLWHRLSHSIIVVNIMWVPYSCSNYGPEVVATRTDFLVRCVVRASRTRKSNTSDDASEFLSRF